MDQFQKLSLLSENMDVEEGENLITVLPEHNDNKPQPIISHAKLPNGRSMPLLKSMITSVCENNCKYCAFRAGRDCQRASFTPDEMADTFNQLNKKNIAQGLFLSSGIAGGSVRIQDKIIDTAAILRKKLNYKGYLHLKIMPGAEYSQIESLMQYADRVSINLEAPNRERLSSLAPKKDFHDALYLRLLWATEIQKKLKSFGNLMGKSPSITTQFVVGPSGESDYELLKTSVLLLNTFHLARIYFMTFRPVFDTPLAETEPEDPLRGHRLYQSSFLMRDYGFGFEDFVFLPNGNLRLDKDPKQIWADNNLTEKPVEINRASRNDLLRIPGIGPKRVKLITEYRQKNLIRSEYDLKTLGIPLEKAGKYLLLNGKRVVHQLPLFAV
jgi:predicted DNA-binding helix-hairpin-helix protein